MSDIPFQPKRWRRWLVIAGLLIAGLAALTLFMTPLVRDRALTELEGLGFGRVEIADISLNPLTGRIGLYGLKTAAGLKLDRLVVKFEWLPLLSRQIVLDSVKLSGMELDLDIGSDRRLLVSGMDTSRWKTPASADKPPADATWRIDLRSVELADMKLKIHKAVSAAAESAVVAKPAKAQASGKSGHTQPAGRTVASVGSVEVLPGSTVTYSDDSLSPPLNLHLTVKRLRLAPLISDKGSIRRLQGDFRLNERAELKLDGPIGTNPSDPYADLAMSVRHLDMTTLSGLLVKDYGQSIRTGQLDADSTVAIERGTIDASNHLVMRKLELQKASAEGRASKSIGLPVDTMLDLLRDKHGDITLDMPVQGRLDDPDVNFDDLVTRASSKALTTATLSYAKYMLQPYGGLLAAGELLVDLAKAADKPRLTPIRFARRSSGLTPAMEQYVDRIVKLMQQKSFRLELCGFSAAEEGVPTQAAEPPIDAAGLLEIAATRSEQVLSRLVDKGIRQDRLFKCQPQIDKKRGSRVPRVELIFDNR